MAETGDTKTAVLVEEARQAVAETRELLGYSGEVRDTFERTALAWGSWQRPGFESVARRERPAIEVSRLRKTYPGGIQAVKGIDFEVAAGEVFGLLARIGALVKKAVS